MDKFGRVRLGESLRGRDNALNLVRLILAAAVVISHSRPLGGFGPDPVIGGRGLGAWAVAGFFAISGYLICASRVRLPWQQFAAARMIRIYPGYWLSLVAVAAVVAPTAAAVTGTRFSPVDAMKYVFLNLAAPVRWSFGDAILQAAHPESWNAPLWTLTDEMCCYVVAGVALAFALVRRRAAWVAGGALAALMILNMALDSSDALSGTRFLDLVHLLGFFTAGALVWAVGDQVHVRGSLVSMASCLAHATDQIAALPVAHLVLAVGASLPGRIGQRRDLSYGLYIFGWPIQTFLCLVGVARWGWAAYFLISFVFMIPVARDHEPWWRDRPGLPETECSAL